MKEKFKISIPKRILVPEHPINSRLIIAPIKSIDVTKNEKFINAEKDYIPELFY